jgi:hypothetical protein
MAHPLPKKKQRYTFTLWNLNLPRDKEKSASEGEIGRVKEKSGYLTIAR